MPVVNWLPDTDLAGFEKTSLAVQYQQRSFTATLVRACNNPDRASKSVLYIHGLTDYFFQAHLAEAYIARGYAFYALDLHAYGRSLKSGERPNYCETLAEYYPEIDAAIALIDAAGASALHVNAHSTGGLIAALYAHEGQQRDRITTLLLNSPFLQFSLPAPARLAVAVVALAGRWFPHFSIQQNKPTLYAQSLYCGFKGEWDYNLDYKPSSGFPLYAAWFRAIRKAQKRAQQGLAINCPVLLMHSTRSIRVYHWSDELLRADSVLDVDHMRRYGPGLGKRVELIEINDAMHDIMLSATPVRQRAMQTLLNWLE